MLTSRHQEGHHPVADAFGLFVVPAALITLGILPVLAVAAIPVLAWGALFALVFVGLKSPRGG